MMNTSVCEFTEHASIGQSLHLRQPASDQATTGPVPTARSTVTCGSRTATDATCSGALLRAYTHVLDRGPRAVRAALPTASIPTTRTTRAERPCLPPVIWGAIRTAYPTALHPSFPESRAIPGRLPARTPRPSPVRPLPSRRRRGYAVGRTTKFRGYAVRRIASSTTAGKSVPDRWRALHRA
jgi:hypothetical protein